MPAVTHLHQAQHGMEETGAGPWACSGDTGGGSALQGTPGPLKGQGQGSELTLEAHLQPR